MPLPTPSATTAALVTGASSGIGADIARELASRGHGLVLVARREDRLRALADELSAAHGVRAEVLACDLTDSDAIAALPGQVERTGLAVDVLVNNAGFGTAGPFETVDAATEARMVRLNCEAVVTLTHAFLPAMLERGRGAVLVVASTAGFQPLPRQAVYGASKAFALSFSEALHTELKDRGIAVSALCPGPVDTEFGAAAGLEAELEKAPGFLKVSSPETARQAVEGLAANKRVVVPGAAMKAVGALSTMTPHAVLLPLLKRFYPV